ncbi:PPC domain-containing protein [Deinococcus sp. YIM 134068]|uniref:PPC domain-containing protein n=1 Tax=Deinococcus lichenicola TaxID=3118910 RepID=UPI002F936175
MQRHRLLSLALLPGLLLAACGVVVPPEVEPNDSVATATPLAIGATVKGTISGTARDYDYYRFDAVAGDQLRLTVKSTGVDAASTLDPHVTVLLPDGVTVFERDDDSGTDQEADLRFNVTQAGTYTAVVTSFDIYDDEEATDDLATNTYQIALTRR